jgi:hypothetical protein
VKVWALVAGMLLITASVSAQTDQIAVTSTSGAILRGLDTVTGKIRDIDIEAGVAVPFERLEITLKECRYPTENPASDAFAYLTIRDVREEKPRFEGWMVASTPALEALDHPRYDVWVLRCKYPDAAPAVTD